MIRLIPSGAGALTGMQSSLSRSVVHPRAGVACRARVFCANAPRGLSPRMWEHRQVGVLES